MFGLHVLCNALPLHEVAIIVKNRQRALKFGAFGWFEAQFDELRSVIELKDLPEEQSGVAGGTKLFLGLR